ncbi:hypothetical protein BDR06DRAFT_977766 [Suillus hirtellus]|nr:hypothetical protein BDR06DRAFT_977766 [Suillus hirtellus]
MAQQGSHITWQDQYLCYVHRLKVGAVHPTAGMHVLKHAKHRDGTPVGNIVPLKQMRTFISIIPELGAAVDMQLTKETSAHYSSSFFLNKYFNKQLYYALYHIGSVCRVADTAQLVVACLNDKLSVGSHLTQKMLSSMSFQQSDIDKFLLHATISSVGVPSGPHTLDTMQALLRQELKNYLIHEGVGRGARIPLENSIFCNLVIKTTLQLSKIKTIQRKGIKRTHGAKYGQDDSTEDSGIEHKDTEDDDMDNGDMDIEDAEIKDAALGIEPSFDSVIHGQSETETWSSQEYQPFGSKKRHRQVPVTTEKEFQCLFYTIQYHLHHAEQWINSII